MAKKDVVKKQEVGDGTEAKPGYKTTEFWMTVAADAVGALMASGVASDSIVMKVGGLVVMVLSTMGYTAARTWAKK